MESEVGGEVGAHSSELALRCTLILNKITSGLIHAPTFPLAYDRQLLHRILVERVNPLLQHYSGLRTRLGELEDRDWGLNYAEWPIQVLHWKTRHHSSEFFAMIGCLWNGSFRLVRYLLDTFESLRWTLDQEIRLTITKTKEYSLECPFEFRGSCLELCALAFDQDCYDDLPDRVRILEMILQVSPKFAIWGDSLVLFLWLRGNKLAYKVEEDVEEAVAFLDTLISAHPNLSQAGSYVAPIQVACLMGNFEAIKLLLHAGANPDDYGNPALKPWGDDSLLYPLNCLAGHTPSTILKDLDTFRGMAGLYEQDLHDLDIYQMEEIGNLLQLNKRE